MSTITLSTLNAKYIHASLGLRYLYANMGSLQSQTKLLEFTVVQRPEDIVEQLLSPDLAIIGFGIYIWNTTQTTDVIRLIKVIRPDILVIIGGPEVSYETNDQAISALADYIVTGAADTSFAELCQELLDNKTPSKQVSSLPASLDTLASPYPFYSEDDVANRVLYVEASRGCPFKCEFCLSSLDKTAVAFDLSVFLTHMQDLIDRGAKQFKFVDRTFNLKADTSKQILEFFLQHIDKGMFLHFELIPDRLPEVLLELLPKFPANSLQFEIGIQSFNPDVQKLISRKQQHEKTCHNLRWVRSNTTAHIHADLIFGLPGETLESFGEGFDLLYSLGPQEIQVGILKRLRGTPIARHTQAFDMRYQPTPPYRILAHKDANFDTVQRMVRFARYWDLIGNSGRFTNTLPLLLNAGPFEHFMALSDWLFQTTTQTHRFALSKLFELLHEFMTSHKQWKTSDVETALLADFKLNKLKGLPMFARQIVSTADGGVAQTSPAQRQRRHITE
ncbi:MAG: DUF4080 domain-containing protein [Granulosicoccaceae bacterium]